MFDVDSEQGVAINFKIMANPHNERNLSTRDLCLICSINMNFRTRPHALILKLYIYIIMCENKLERLPYIKNARQATKLLWVDEKFHSCCPEHIGVLFWRHGQRNCFGSREPVVTCYVLPQWRVRSSTNQLTHLLVYYLLLFDFCSPGKLLFCRGFRRLSTGKIN